MDSYSSPHTIFSEMMSHPVLFTHLQPKKVGIIGDEEDTILNEVIKHEYLSEIHQIKSNTKMNLVDPRIQTHEHFMWINKPQTIPFDIMIILSDATPELLQTYYNLLDNNGILLQISCASLFDPIPLKSLMTQLKQIGFKDLHTLYFPQPDYLSGWRTAVIALKEGIFKRLREKTIFNKPFKTYYYNFDIHRAAMVLPEFLRETVI